MPAASWGFSEPPGIDAEGHHRQRLAVRPLQLHSFKSRLAFSPKISSRSEEPAPICRM